MNDIVEHVLTEINKIFNKKMDNIINIVNNLNNKINDIDNKINDINDKITDIDDKIQNAIDNFNNEENEEDKSVKNSSSDGFDKSMDTEEKKNYVRKNKFKE